MLRDVLIQNLAIIHSLTLSFEPGLNVITGETGAGKSILLHAIDLLVGARANRAMIRSGAHSLYVEGVFTLDKLETAVFELLEKNGVPCEDPMTISRAMLTNGKSTARVEGQLVSAADLRTVGDLLMDMFGQQDRMLLEKESQIRLLDTFLNLSAKEDLKEYRRLRLISKEIENEMTSLFIEPDERAREIDVLMYQIEELEELGLNELDPELLIEEHRRFSHLEESVTYLDAMQSKLTGESEMGFGLRSMLQELQALGNRVEALDPQVKLTEPLLEMEEAASDLLDLVASYRAQSEPDPERFAELEAFMEAWTKAQRKYGSSPEQMAAFMEEAKKRLETLEEAEERIVRLQKQRDQNQATMQQLADTIHTERCRISEELSAQMQERLRALRMEDVVFRIEVSSTDTMGQNGRDEVTFYLITNKGQAMRPLHEIASGGEMSRVMLAMKSLSAQIQLPNTIVFDEVDAGVSGLAAQSMAEELHRLSRNTQIIAVTHLPQIAAMADAHYSIQKETKHNETYSHVNRLDEDEREQEIARLLSGSKRTEHAVAQARDLLTEAARWKKERK